MSAPVTTAPPRIDLELAPRFVIEPVATEALIEAAPASIDPAGLRARMLPLFAAEEDKPSAILARVEDPTGNVTHEWPYGGQSWCIQAWSESRSDVASTGDECDTPHAAAVAVDRSSREHLFSLPPVRQMRLAPLLTGALLFGRPGLCPAVFDPGVWDSIAAVFRQALPNEALVTLTGNLCQDPVSGKMFTLIDGASAVGGSSAPDAVCGSADDVATAVTEGSGGLLVGAGHSHPAQGASGKVLVSKTDFETFRLQLRAAHMVSLIANVTPGGPMEAIVLSWIRGGAMPTGFYVAGWQGKEVPEDENGN